MRSPTLFASRWGACVLLLALAQGLVSPAAAQTPADRVRAAFERYREAVLARDGAAALDAVDARTVDYYRQSVDLALDADSAAVASLPFLDELMVLTLRHRVPPDTLRAFDGASAFVYGVEQGWISPSSVRRQRLGRVTVAGDSARAELAVDGESVPEVAFAFARERGDWRLDLTSVTALAGASLRAQAAALDLTEGAYIALLLETVSGRPVKPVLWRPVGRDS